MVSFILLIIGGLNWLLTAFDYNIVDKIFGVGSTASKVIYILVGLAALLEMFVHKKDCKTCSVSMPIK